LSAIKEMIIMEIVKMPKMEKKEYDQLIMEQYIARITFSGEKYPYIAPFLYVFDGDFLYFLSTKYGKKMKHFRQNPYVTVEIETYNSDMSNYAFVSLSGHLVEVTDEMAKKEIREHFIRLIKEKNLSENIMVALGHSSQDSTEVINSEERNFIWKLIDVKKITGLKNH
jgi:nitroimidazol reductase NimA-like FMN-containing flavoprotein (pyridoxamine 5'-phosphate oxidase superfamily)